MLSGFAVPQTCQDLACFWVFALTTLSFWNILPSAHHVLGFFLIQVSAQPLHPSEAFPECPTSISCPPAGYLCFHVPQSTRHWLNILVDLFLSPLEPKPHEGNPNT